MGKAGQNHLFQACELLVDGGVDARVGMAEQVDPPGTDGIQIAPAVKVIQPCARTARDRHQRQGAAVVQLHLRAGMPDRRAAALKPVGVIHGGSAESRSVRVNTLDGTSGRAWKAGLAK